MSEEGKNNEQPDQTKLSQVYAELARETVPPDLDRKVLGLAESGKHQAARKWGRPIAIAATITICFSLLLKLADTPQYPRTESRGADSATREQHAPASTPAATGNSTGITNAASPAPGEKVMQVPTKTAVSPADVATARARVGAGSEESLMITADSEAGAPICPAISREKPESWWQCIAEIREQGMEDEAKVEQQLFDQAFPDFVPPK